MSDFMTRFRVAGLLIVASLMTVSAVGATGFVAGSVKLYSYDKETRVLSGFADNLPPLNQYQLSRSTLEHPAIVDLNAPVDACIRAMKR